MSIFKVIVIIPVDIIFVFELLDNPLVLWLICGSYFITQNIIKAEPESVIQLEDKKA